MRSAVHSINPSPSDPLPPSARNIFRPRRDWKFWACVTGAFLVHFAIFSPAFFNMSCLHDRPLGLPGGSGDKIAKGIPEGVLGGTGKDAGAKQTVVKARTDPKVVANLTPIVQKSDRSRDRMMKRFNENGFVVPDDNKEVQLTAEQQSSATLDKMGTGNGGGEGDPAALGLPGGQGGGATAAGSPWGTRIGAKLWLYRVKYSGGDWDANPRGLNILLKEVTKVIKTNYGGQEVVTLSELPKHRGEYFPSMLFITGTGRLSIPEDERKNLRNYLLGGGFLVADSSGGDFERQFLEVITNVLPGKKVRPIEHDHLVFRGANMPYQLPAGCPIYRDHGSSEARGLFDDDNRLLVFISPGDIGDAWETVDLGRKRGAVEHAFQMGTNLVAYSLRTVRDKEKEKKEMPAPQK